MDLHMYDTQKHVYTCLNVPTYLSACILCKIHYCNVANFMFSLLCCRDDLHIPVFVDDKEHFLVFATSSTTMPVCTYTRFIHVIICVVGGKLTK